MFNVKKLSKLSVRALASLMLVAAMAIAASAPFTQPVRAAAPSPVMFAMTTEQVEAAVEEYFEAVSEFDVQRYVNTFAPDGVIEDPVGTPPIQGIAASGANLANLSAPFSEIKHKIQEINVCGLEAAVNWKLNLKTTTNKRITVDGMGVFKFNEGGKIVLVREFWDLQALLSQLQN